MKKFNFKKINWRGILSAILVGALLIGVIAGVAVWAKDKTKTLSPTIFSRGALDENGDYVENDKALYTKDSFPCIGLRVEPDFEYNGTYDVYYYDPDDRLLTVKENLTGVYDEDYPLASHCRIVMYPGIPEDVNAKDFKINFWEVLSYANKFTIEVNKDQTNLYGERINLYVEENAEIGKTFDATGWNETLTVVEEENMKVSEDISVNGDFNKYDIYVRYAENSTAYTHAVVVADADDKVLVRQSFNLADLEDGEWCKLTLEIPDDYDDDMYIKVRMHVSAECYIFGYND